MQLPERDEILFVPERSEIIRRRHRRRIVFGAVLVCLILLALAAKPTVRALRAWHARRLAREAIELVARQQWQGAAANIKQASLLAANDAVVLRSQARFLTATRNFLPALNVWQRFADKSGDHWTADDRRDYATAALGQGELAAASAQLQLLRQIPSADRPADHLLAARLAERLGDRITEGDECLRVLNFAASTETERCDAAILVLSNIRDPAQRSAAWAAMENTASGSSAVALQALLFLASQQLNPTLESTSSGALRNDPRRVIQALETHPLADVSSKLRALDLRLKLEPSSADKLVASTIAKAEGFDDRQLSIFSLWLIVHARATEALRLLPPERAFLSRELSIARVEAMSAVGLWKELEAELEDPTTGSKVDEIMAQIALAKCAAKLDEKAAFVNAWDRAFELAEGDQAKLLGVGRAAEAENLPERAETAYRAVLALDPANRAGYAALLSLVARRHGAGQAGEILNLMSKQWPDDPGIRNAAVYTGLISDSLAAPAARTAMEPLVRDYPLETSYRATLALACLREGNPVQALRAFGESIDIAAKGPIRPSTLAVHALVLAANDMKMLARMEAEKLPLNELASEERDFLAPVFNSAK